MFVYEKFGTTDLPVYNPNYSVGVMASVDVFVQTAGGVFDAGGDDQIGVAQTILSHRGVVTGETEAEFIANIRNFRKMRGTKAKLYRRWSDGTLEWVYARCVAVEGTRSFGMIWQQELDFRFQIISQVWYSYSATSEQYTLSSSPQNETITYIGDAVVENVVITITAGSADLTYVSILNTNNSGLVNITYTGTIASGDAVVIDCGALSVTNDGDDAYDDFGLEANHVAQSWFVLAPGGNRIDITFTGGGTGSTVKFDYYDGWH